MKGLVSHTRPSGVSYQSAKNRCEQNLKKLEKLVDEGWKIAGSEVKKTCDEHPKQVVIAISGWEALGSITINFREFMADYQDKPVKVIRKIY